MTVGDDLVPDANMVFDRARVLPAPPEEVWPWLVQLGKKRAGWYLPARVERFVPRRRRALRRLEPRFQLLHVGDEIPDYGGRDETLEVALIKPAQHLVYTSERQGARFSWALVLEPLDGGRARLRLRFRGQIKSTGVTREVIVKGGELFDWATAELMLSGLAERL